MERFSRPGSKASVIRGGLSGAGASLAPSLPQHPHLSAPLRPALGSGSDAASLVTSAVRRQDHYILNGSKVHSQRPRPSQAGWQPFPLPPTRPMCLQVNLPENSMWGEDLRPISLCSPSLFLLWSEPS